MFSVYVRRIRNEVGYSPRSIVQAWFGGLRRIGARVQIAVATLSGNSLRQTVHTHCASVHQAAKLVAAVLRVARVTAGLAESNASALESSTLTTRLPSHPLNSGTSENNGSRYFIRYSAA